MRAPPCLPVAPVTRSFRVAIVAVCGVGACFVVELWPQNSTEVLRDDDGLLRRVFLKEREMLKRSLHTLDGSYR